MTISGEVVRRKTNLLTKVDGLLENAPAIFLKDLQDVKFLLESLPMRVTVDCIEILESKVEISESKMKKSASKKGQKEVQDKKDKKNSKKDKEE